MTPTDHTSAFGPGTWVRSTTSGAMYAGVPEMSPRRAAPSSAASPKSMTLQSSGAWNCQERGSFRTTITFSGLMSRCTMRCAWQYAAAESTWRRRRAAAASASGPCLLRRPPQSPPWSRSSTMTICCESYANSKILTMLGWSSLLRRCTSRRTASCIRALRSLVAQTFTTLSERPPAFSRTADTSPKAPRLRCSSTS